ncbi:hypothetical protein RND71_007450 [Anisodus tanguticus]|uniref:Uncharacterized protein n=1 Tax=Anisodus tanguticus TaxID=243964 RepID=A0AAE1SNT2_9SOLA|nr:hypothetical protein RND71_007450 [Anisodus tanguticus]
MPDHLGHNTDHSFRVAATMAENASWKRDVSVSVFTYPRRKIPKGTLPHMKNVPETGGGLLLPPQLTGRSNVVTEDITKLFLTETSDRILSVDLTVVLFLYQILIKDINYVIVKYLLY